MYFNIGSFNFVSIRTSDLPDNEEFLHIVQSIKLRLISDLHISIYYNILYLQSIQQCNLISHEYEWRIPVNAYVALITFVGVYIHILHWLSVMLSLCVSTHLCSQRTIASVLLSYQSLWRNTLPLYSYALSIMILTIYFNHLITTHALLVVRIILVVMRIF